VENETDSMSEFENTPPILDENKSIDLPVFSDNPEEPILKRKRKYEPTLKVLFLLLIFVWTVEVLLQVVVMGGWMLLKFMEGARGDELQSLFSSLPLLMLLSLNFLSWCITITACLMVMKSQYKKSFAEVFKFNKVPLRAYAEGFVVSIVGILFVSLMSQFMQEPDDSLMSEMMVKKDAEGNAIGLAIPMMLFAILAPVVEEMYYRGFLFSAFKGLMGTFAAFLIIIIWFAGIHAFQLGGNVAALSIIMYMGAMWTWLRYKYDSILPGMFSHFIYNGTIVTISALAIKYQSILGE
jgi:hypothetical protein